MYRDWSGFELFFIEILKSNSLPALLQIGHRFETFLMTLYREVQKRSVLHGQTAPDPLDGDTGPIPVHA
jgi:ABC-type Fe3+ transport system permease subunit